MGTHSKTPHHKLNSPSVRYCMQRSFCFPRLLTSLHLFQHCVSALVTPGDEYFPPMPASPHGAVTDWQNTNFKVKRFLALFCFWQKQLNLKWISNISLTDIPFAAFLKENVREIQQKKRNAESIIKFRSGLHIWLTTKTKGTETLLFWFWILTSNRAEVCLPGSDTEERCSTQTSGKLHVDITKKQNRSKIRSLQIKDEYQYYK